VAWNKRWEEQTGIKKVQVIGKHFLEQFSKVSQNKHLKEAMDAALAGNYVHLSANPGLYTDNYYERYYIPLKNDEGDVYAVLNILHDITNLIHQSQELNDLNRTLEKKNKELGEKNEEITHFAFVASHDLKEPLRKIATFSDWLLNNEAERLSTRGQELIRKTANSVRRMDTLIQDILVLTHIHSDAERKLTVNLNAILEQVQNDMKEMLAESGAEIVVEKLPMLSANSNQLFYLFKNLVSNSIKFQKPGNVPVIKITSELTEGASLPASLHADALVEYAAIHFTDNGFGFDTRYTKKIFQVFQRLHGNHEFEGTGIGLAICKKIMENHSGLIAVKSKEGEGSTFSCYFPLT
jgi:light-regulated signal transduction histidine kinase (bacteriophytochrome)